MAKVYLEFTREEMRRRIPYAMVCEGQNGSRWNTTRRRRRWMAEFSKRERSAAGGLFRQAHNWMLGCGVPKTVRMTFDTYRLWLKLGNFCASL